MTSTIKDVENATSEDEVAELISNPESPMTLSKSSHHGCELKNIDVIDGHIFVMVMYGFGEVQICLCIFPREYQYLEGCFKCGSNKLQLYLAKDKRC